MHHEFVVIVKFDFFWLFFRFWGESLRMRWTDHPAALAQKCTSDVFVAQNSWRFFGCSYKSSKTWFLEKQRNFSPPLAIEQMTAIIIKNLSEVVANRNNSKNDTFLNSSFLFWSLESSPSFSFGFSAASSLNEGCWFSAKAALSTRVASLELKAGCGLTGICGPEGMTSLCEEIWKDPGFCSGCLSEPGNPTSAFKVGVICANGTLQLISVMADFALTEILFKESTGRIKQPLVTTPCFFVWEAQVIKKSRWQHVFSVSEG